MNAVSQPIRPQTTNEEVLMAGNEQDEADEGLEELFAEDEKEDVPEPVDLGEGKDDGEEHPDDQGRGGAAARVLPDPGEPTASQIEDHRAC